MISLRKGSTMPSSLTVTCSQGCLGGLRVASMSMDRTSGGWPSAPASVSHPSTRALTCLGFMNFST